jgi:hypothetical protein
MGGYTKKHSTTEMLHGKNSVLKGETLVENAAQGRIHSCQKHRSKRIK